MRRHYFLAVLALVAMMAAAPSWNETTCDRTTPVPAGFADAPTAAGDVPTRAGVGYGTGGLPGLGIIGIP
jgi:hypothetical protein